jgi:hypothetical protein
MRKCSAWGRQRIATVNLHNLASIEVIGSSGEKDALRERPLARSARGLFGAGVS